MGEIADLMINGDICEGCGVELGEGDGYPRRCAYCQRNEAAMKPQPATDKVNCSICHKRVKAAGLHDHMRAVHEKRIAKESP